MNGFIGVVKLDFFWIDAVLKLLYSLAYGLYFRKVYNKVVTPVFCIVKTLIASLIDHCRSNFSTGSPLVCIYTKHH